MNILIVDDSQVIQRVLSMQLRKNGYEVTVASSGTRGAGTPATGSH